MPVVARVVTNSPLVQELLAGDNTEHLRRHVEECRKGDFSGLDCLRSGLHFGLTTFEEVGTSDEEMQKFYEDGRLAPDLAKAKELLAAVRGGDFEQFKALSDLLDEGTVGSDNLGLENEEYGQLVGEYNRFIGTRTVEECRRGDFSGYDNLAHGWTGGHFTLEEVGTDAGELVQFQRDRYIVPAKRCLEEAKDGNFENVEELQELVNSGKVGVELGVTQEGLNQILKPHYVEQALKALAECREGDIDLLPKLRNVIAHGPVTYDDLGTTEDEVEGFERRKAIGEMREIAEQCRSGDYSGLPLLVTAVKVLPLAGELTQQEVESLDLELDVWKRRDEINGAHELMQALRDRGGLEKAEHADRQLLSRFTAEELGLSEEDYLLLITPDQQLH